MARKRLNTKFLRQRDPVRWAKRSTAGARAGSAVGTNGRAELLGFALSLNVRCLGCQVWNAQVRVANLSALARVIARCARSRTNGQK
jgi:hypothetical protein